MQSALDVDGERLLDEEERLAIAAQMDTLRELAGGSDTAAIENQIKRLSQVTDAFAARRMDATVKAAPPAAGSTKSRNKRRCRRS